MKEYIFMVKPLLQHKGVLEYNVNSKQDQTEMAVSILKFLRKTFSINKTYHSYSNSFHTFFDRT